MGTACLRVKLILSSFSYLNVKTFINPLSLNVAYILHLKMVSGDILPLSEVAYLYGPFGIGSRTVNVIHQ